MCNTERLCNVLLCAVPISADFPFIVIIIPDLVVSPILYFLLLGFLHPIWDLVVPSLLSMLQAFV